VKKRREMAEIIYSEKKPIEITLYELTLRAIADLALANALIRLETEPLDRRKSGLLSKVSDEGKN
jgi:hypothetical protein